MIIKYKQVRQISEEKNSEEQLNKVLEGNEVKNNIQNQFLSVENSPNIL